jgi:hypothetical protein
MDGRECGLIEMLTRNLRGKANGNFEIVFQSSQCDFWFSI